MTSQGMGTSPGFGYRGKRLERHDLYETTQMNSKVNYSFDHRGVNNVKGRKNFDLPLEESAQFTHLVLVYLISSDSKVLDAYFE